MNGNQLLFVKAFRAVVRPPRELDLGAFGLDAALLQLCFRRLQRRPGALQCGARFTHPRHQVLAVELDEHGARFDLLIHFDRQKFDDAVGFRFDFDFGDGLDLPGRHDGACECAPLDRGKPRLRDARWSTEICRRTPPDQGKGKDRHAAVNRSFSGLGHLSALSDGRLGRNVAMYNAKLSAKVTNQA